jgi:hypothetical protein
MFESFVQPVPGKFIKFIKFIKFARAVHRPTAESQRLTANSR